MDEEPQRTLAGRPDPWRVVADLTNQVGVLRAQDAPLADRLDAERARFGGAIDDIAGLLDEVDRRAIVDVDAPVDSVRPGVPQLKLAVRKANAFLARHLAQQVTVLVQALSIVARDLDTRVRALEAEDDLDELIAMAPDHRAAAERLLGDHLPVGGTRRDVRTRSELRTLPSADADLVVLSGLLDVLPAALQRQAVAAALAGVRAGGRLALVTTTPAAWASTISPVLRDLAPGRSLHASTLEHVLVGAGAADVEQATLGDAQLVVATR